MVDSTPDPLSGETAPDGDSAVPPRMPRWVRVLLIVVGAAVLLLVTLQLIGVGGTHGPGRHGAAEPIGPSLASGVAVPDARR